jgi:hypothetical protein
VEYFGARENRRGHAYSGAGPSVCFAKIDS